MAINASFSEGPININNRGTISSDAITIGGLDGYMELRNSGNLFGGKFGSAVTFQGTDGFIHNSGLIAFDNVGIALVNAEAKIVNTGHIRVSFDTEVNPGPAITDLGGGSVTLVNRGVIDGTVALRSPVIRHCRG